MLPPVFGALLAFVTSLFRAHASLRPENLVPRGANTAERINVEEIRATGRARDCDTRQSHGGGVRDGRELYRLPAGRAQFGFDPRRYGELPFSGQVSCRGPRAPTPLYLSTGETSAERSSSGSSSWSLPISSARSPSTRPSTTWLGSASSSLSGRS
jgi:hypothetical protein